MRNPIIAENVPDPAVVNVKDKGYYLVATAGSPNRKSDSVFTIRHSPDLVAWKRVSSVFPRGKWPTWAKKDFWAPEIHDVGRKYVTYYTARDGGGRLSIGAASSKRVTGPYEDLGRPLVRDARTGVIDPTFFRTRSGQNLLIWKLDGNAVGKRTPIYVQPLSADGLKLEGRPRQLIENDRPWEGPLVEAPWMVKRGDYYYLFYSGNMYNTDRYAVGVARSRTPFGPFEKAPEPILRSNTQWAGPGHGAVVQRGGKDYFVYHAWKRDAVGDPNPRMLLIDRVDWEGGWPKINDGTPSGTPEAVR